MSCNELRQYTRPMTWRCRHSEGFRLPARGTWPVGEVYEDRRLQTTKLNEELMVGHHGLQTSRTSNITDFKHHGLQTSRNSQHLCNTLYKSMPFCQIFLSNKINIDVICISVSLLFYEHFYQQLWKIKFSICNQTDDKILYEHVLILISL